MGQDMGVTEHDDTDMTNDEFEQTFAEGQEVNIVTSRAEFELRTATSVARFIHQTGNSGAEATSVLIGGLSMELGPLVGSRVASEHELAGR